MRLDFNVLWVDDQPDVVSAQIKAITRRMEEEGFRFNATMCNSIGDVSKLISDDVFTDEVDLILVDWNLGGGVLGQNVIAKIRETVPYKDVVFYSAAQSDANELRKVAFEKNIEGVYCASRGELVEEVLGVFNSLVKKVLDLDHTRGIVMGATSDIDHMVSECLLALHERLDANDQRTVIAEAVARIDERIIEITSLAESLRTATAMKTMLDAHLVFTAYDRLRTLTKLLKHGLFKNHGDARKSVIQYMEKVVPQRNNLGHLVLAPEGKTQAIANRDGKQVSLDEMRELRRTILGLRQDFKTLSLALKN